MPWASPAAAKRLTLSMEIQAGREGPLPASLRRGLSLHKGQTQGRREWRYKVMGTSQRNEGQVREEREGWRGGGGEN